MINESQSERTNQAYIRAELNPDINKFRDVINSKPQVSYFDIGCGIHPRISVALEKNDLWVGCDPAISAKGDQTIVNSGCRVHPDSKRFIYSDIAAEVPEFKPDYIMCIAPNPQDVVEGNIINDELEKFLDEKKTQFFYVFFDDRTQQSQGYRKDAIIETLKWTRKHKFYQSDTNPLRGTLSINSDDLGVYGAKRFIFRRTPRR